MTPLLELRGAPRVHGSGETAVTALPARISRGTQPSTVINVRPSADASGKSRTSISRIRKTVCLQCLICCLLIDLLLLIFCSK